MQLRYRAALGAATALPFLTFVCPLVRLQASSGGSTAVTLVASAVASLPLVAAVASAVASQPLVAAVASAVASQPLVAAVASAVASLLHAPRWLLGRACPRQLMHPGGRADIRIHEL
jgi:hypothetical protein